MTTIVILLVAIIALNAATFVVAVVGTNFDIRAWRLPIIGNAVQAVAQKLLKGRR